MSRKSTRRVRGIIALGVAGLLAGSVGAGTLTRAHAATAAAAPGSYQVDDYAQGNADFILPPGENGLENATDVVQSEAGGARPAGSDDQLAPYTNLIYGAPSLTDAGLSSFYNDESFGVKPADIVRTETAVPGAMIYRDTHDVPHIYGQTDDTMSEAAGYTQAEDRLFLMDVLRHYGEGTLSEFLGASCAFEQMDHDELKLAPYTTATATDQIQALPREYGDQGAKALDLIENYVKGINDFISATQTDPTLLPADYAAALSPPTQWTDVDVVAIAGLIGGIFGKGGGIEFQNAGLLEYLQKQLGSAAGAAAFADFKDSDDPDAPTTIVDKTFPYEQHGVVDPSTTALPDAGAAFTDPTTAQTTGCNLSQPVPGGPALPPVPLVAPGAGAQLAGLQITHAFSAIPKHMSNALVVNADHSATGHPIAVFGPQVSYFAPQILALEDLHGPDYDAEGASFPGTGLVELGRGQDYAWSATSAGTDLIDQRLEKLCDPAGGKPTAQQPDYLFNGVCTPMTVETFADPALTPKPGGQGISNPTLSHTIELTQHGVVQGFTTSGGQPVALVNERSTFNHDIDSVVGFLDWGQPSRTHDAASWFQGAESIEYTFNWFYVDDTDTAYYTSGLDPVRPANVDPALPTWGTGNAEWQGYLGDDDHPHEINPPQGFFVSWNNKPAPGFSAADDMFGYGLVYRSQLLVNQLKAGFAAHGKLTRSQVVQAMSAASTQDLDGVAVLPELLSYLGSTAGASTAQTPAVTSALAILRAWVATGTHRVKNATTDTQYRDAAAVAIMDELEDQLIQAMFDPILAAGGKGKVGSTGGAMTAGYSALPMQWVNSPNSGDSHLGSAYDSGYESYLVKALRQLQGEPVTQPFGTAITSTWCGSGGTTACSAAIEKALATTVTNLTTANGGSTTASSWTLSPDLVADQTATNSSSETMPQYDAIHFDTLGVIGQPAQDWQNRPTFQQVLSFPAHRPRAVVPVTLASPTFPAAVPAPTAPPQPTGQPTAKPTTKPTGKAKATAKPSVRPHPAPTPRGVLALGTTLTAPTQVRGTLAFTGGDAALGWLALAGIGAGVSGLLARRRQGRQGRQ